MTPERIQLQRTKGWRMPEGTIKVDRTTPWGNPFKATDVYVTGSKYSAPGEAIGLVGAVRAFRASWLHKLKRWPDETEAQLAQIRGHSLACWCKPGALCHADVLLELANAERPV